MEQNKYIDPILPNTEIQVVNAKTEDKPVVTVEDYQRYFRRMDSHLTCPSCGKKMYRAKDRPSIKAVGGNIMVCAHVQTLPPIILNYVTLICKECNDKKTNLPPFKVKLGNLISLSEFYHHDDTPQRQKT